MSKKQKNKRSKKNKIIKGLDIEEMVEKEERRLAKIQEEERKEQERLAKIQEEERKEQEKLEKIQEEERKEQENEKEESDLRQEFIESLKLENTEKRIENYSKRRDAEYAENTRREYLLKAMGKIEEQEEK